MSSIAIRTEDLTRDFPTVRAVDSLSLEIPTGIIFGFLGPNGAGKTTTIRLLLGLLEPDNGRGEVLGFDVQTEADRIRERVGALLENDGLYERLTAYDNLDFFGEINHLPTPDRRDRIRHLMEHLDLWDRRSEQAGKFSRGMKKKLALARALLHQPTLLFLDEPTTGLDALSAVALRDDLTSLVHQEGVTVFLTTHNMAEAEKICDRVGVIHKGQLVVEGRPDEIGAQARQPIVKVIGSGFTPEILAEVGEVPQVVEVIRSEDGLTIRLKEQGETAELVHLLVSRGAQVEEVHKVGASLEEAFITLMGEQSE
ncbi:MAG: ABC transporter ATP-binding protein [Anaerolineaceae bacterium]|nr:MAG: ABC transporter ATP-binding protein [Anaerolineaceae bacterium]